MKENMADLNTYTMRARHEYVHYCQIAWIHALSSSQTHQRVCGHVQ